MVCSGRGHIVTLSLLIWQLVVTEQLYVVLLIVRPKEKSKIEDWHRIFGYHDFGESSGRLQYNNGDRGVLKTMKTLCLFEFDVECQKTCVVL